jgi:hypothetical protein
MQGKSQASVVSLSARAHPIVVGAGHASDALDPGPMNWDGSCECIVLCDARLAPTPPSTGHSSRRARSGVMRLWEGIIVRTGVRC